MNALKHRGISLMVLVSLAVIGIALTPAPASAQTSIFMKVDGIPGSSTDAKHPAWINVASLGQSASYPSTSAVGGGAPRVTGACDLEVLKGLDAAGPKLWLALFQGTRPKEVRIEVWMTRPAGDQVQVYEVILTNPIITSITAASAVTFAETVRFSGDGIGLKVFNYSPNGSLLGGTEATWNCKTLTQGAPGVNF